MINNKICVVGSLNMDYCYRCKSIPKEGETILSKEVSKSCGGKGSNQAIAIAKMGGKVSMIGAVGDDEDGKTLIDNLKKNHVNTVGILIKDQTMSGSAVILVDEKGQNSIVVNPAANFKLTIEDIKKKEHIIKDSHYCLMQLEIPLDVIEYVIDFCVKNNVEVVLNPAPMNNKINHKLLQKVNYLIPNETECEQLIGKEFSVESVRKYIKNEKQKIIITLGSQGSCFVNLHEDFFIEAIPVKAIDTTAAGDSYIGALLSYLAKGASDKEAMTFASKIASITVTRRGASESIPKLSEISG